MIRFCQFSLILISLLISIPGQLFCQQATLFPNELRCEYLLDPVGIDVARPRLSWKLSTIDSSLRNLRQLAYQVLVATSPGKLSEKSADVWNSGKLLKSSSVQNVYDGKPLKTGIKYFWKVRVWDQQDRRSAWSTQASWSMGMLTQADWKAKWIGDEPDRKQEDYIRQLKSRSESDTTPFVNRRPADLPSPILRKTFTAKNQILRSTIYVTSLGYYELSINGKKIGNQLLAPEWTDYNKRVQYQAYEVPIAAGKNVITALLADGWYMSMIGPSKWSRLFPLRGSYGSDRRLLAQLVIDYADGTKQTVVTDESWKIQPNGFILSADNFLGETIDARNIPDGYTTVDYDDRGWQPVFVDNSISKNLVAQKNEPVRAYQQIKPINISVHKQVLIVDFGQNLTGITSLKLKGNRGDTVWIRHGEMLQEDGALYTENLDAARQEDVYILSGSEDVFEPRFTYHGFRFVELKGLKQPLTNQMITALAVSSDPEVTGSFECSNPRLNKLAKNILWTQRNNMTSVPTDCPQRDERMGWMGDAQVFCQASIFNMNMAAFYTKWLQDIRDAQSIRGSFPDIAPHGFEPDRRFSNAPAWADAGVIIPWRLYTNYGDKHILQVHYESMKRYIENIHRQNPSHLWIDDVGNQYGDWLNANTIVANGYSNTRGEVPKDVFATAFYYNSVRLFSAMAGILSNRNDEAKYRKLADSIKQTFNKTYVDDSVFIKGNTQSAYALALHFDLLPQEKRQRAFDRMIDCIREYDNRISTGFVTTIMMMKELVRGGRTDLAYMLLESDRFPSWLYSIEQGATTIWERWDGYVKGRGFQDPGMNSFNHYSIGAVGEWMYRTILGFEPDEQSGGYDHFIIHPRPGGTIQWAKGSYNSIKGRISTNWRFQDGNFLMTVEIPVNCTATVILPVQNAGTILLDGKAVSDRLIRQNPASSKETAIDLGSGKYQFTVSGL